MLALPPPRAGVIGAGELRAKPWRNVRAELLGLQRCTAGRTAQRARACSSLRGNNTGRTHGLGKAGNVFIVGRNSLVNADVVLLQGFEKRDNAGSTGSPGGIKLFPVILQESSPRRPICRTVHGIVSSSGSYTACRWDKHSRNRTLSILLHNLRSGALQLF